MFDFAVVGNGLFGSAAARYLTETDASVALIGPSEPANPASHAGVFASHYDEGRLTRRFDQKPAWGEATTEAMAAYRELEELSGISFYEDVGALIARPAIELEDSSPQGVLAELRTQGIPHDLFLPGDRSWQAEFPYLDFPDSHYVVHEPSPAGYINPRKLVQAQNQVAVDNGLTLIDDIVIERSDQADVTRLRTTGGRVITASKILIAAGAFSNFNGLVETALPLTFETEIIALGRVSAGDAKRRRRTPTVRYEIDDPVLSNVYMTPPLQYPDGNWYIKLGANTTADLAPVTLEQVQDWFRSGDSDWCRADFRRALTRLWPTTGFADVQTGRCILCRTLTKLPLIEQLHPRLFVATGGNGAGAKGSDTWGKRAAAMMCHTT